MDWLWVLLVAVRSLSPSPDDAWASRLAQLDEIRQEAFETARPALLDDVYVTGSAALQVDAATIGSYADRDGRVAGATLMVWSCRVVRSTADQVELDVVDQLARAEVRWGDGTSTALPRDAPTRRTMTLVRTTDGWRIAATRPVSPRR